jgi:N-acetyl-anhydromuramyl-L-alanine amidase AmpD
MKLPFTFSSLFLLMLSVFFVAFNSPIKVAIVDKKISWGFKRDANRSIDAVIIHSTYNANGVDSFSVQGVLEQFKSYGVASHYLIDRKGVIYRLVDERNVAFHAGASTLPDGRVNVNSTSIGIEIITTLYCQPTEEQYVSVAALVKEINSRHPLKYVKGHCDIAPGRKSDPWNFDWTKFNLLIQ